MGISVKTSYITIEDANNYFAGKVNTETWDTSSNNEKTKALIEASTIIDKFNYCDQKYNFQQEHEFPRDILWDTVRYDTDNVPFDIKYAVAELAAKILDGFDHEQAIKDAIIKNDAMSLVKTEYDTSVISQHVAAGVPPAVWTFLSPYIRDCRSVVINRVS